MFRRDVIAAIVLGLGIAGAAQADLFTFSPTGLAVNNIPNAAFVDEAPGNLIAVNAVPTAVGGTFTALYQANLSAVEAASTAVLFANGTSVGGQNRFFTFTASFQEQIISVAPGGCPPPFPCPFTQ